MRTIICTILASSIAVAVFAAPQKGKSGGGATVFQEWCAGCHGPDGHSQTELGKKIGARDLTSDYVKQMSLDDIVTQVKKGKGKMPGFEGKLSDAEISAVASYVKDLK
jgi:mono/diheme cytochrome c family protein